MHVRRSSLNYYSPARTSINARKTMAAYGYPVTPIRGNGKPGLGRRGGALLMTKTTTRLLRRPTICNTAHASIQKFRSRWCSAEHISHVRFRRRLSHVKSTFRHRTEGRKRGSSTPRAATCGGSVGLHRARSFSDPFLSSTRL